MTDRAQRDFFDAFARPFAARYGESPAFAQRREVFGRVAREALARSGPGKRCLDLGCGPGVLSHDFAKAGFAVTGVDFSPVMIEEARKTPGVTFVAEDLARYAQTHDQQRALIVLSSVLEYVEDPVGLVRRLSVLLEPGGTLAFSIPNHRSLFRRAEPLFERLAPNRYRHAWKNSLRVKDYLELARELGLRCDRVEHFGFPGRVLRPLSPGALVGTLTLVVLFRP